MDALGEDDVVQAWYLRSDGGKHDVAQEAYRDAVEYLERELKGKTETIAWIGSKSSLDEIRAEAEQVETQYLTASAAKKSVLSCMRKISAWIMFYGQVLDVLAQHHPEYVSLAWGAAKFLLLGILNHEKLSSGISQALSEISDVLPRMELHAKLYPTQRMRESLSRLYAHILLFLRRAVAWFSSSSTSRALSSILRPFELKHRSLIDGIRVCAESIASEADAAAKAEVRGLHVEVRGLHIQVRELHTQVCRTTQGISRLEAFVTARFADVHAKLDNMRGEIGGIRVTGCAIQDAVRDLQRNEILNNLRPVVDPDVILRKHRALARRAAPWRGGDPGTVDLIQCLGCWVSTPAPTAMPSSEVGTGAGAGAGAGAPIMILQAGPRAQMHAREVAMELVEVLEQERVAVAWYLPGAGIDIPGQQKGGQQQQQQEEEAVRIEILRSLVFQVMRHAPDAVVGRLDAARFQGRHDENEWLDLLCLVVGQMPRCFLLVETSSTSAAAAGVGEGNAAPTQAKEIMAMLEAVAERCRSDTNLLKIMMLAGNADLASAIENPEVTTVMTVQKPTPPPPHLRRPRTRQNPRALAWAGVKKHV